MVLICIKIFMARILDVSLGTIRTVLTVKNRSLIATLIAFFELLIWFYVAREALTYGNAVYIPISYALGYATGTYIGSIISRKYFGGFIRVDIITTNEDLLKNSSYHYSTIKLINTYDLRPRYLIIVYLNSRYLKELIKVVNTIDKRAFYTISEVKDLPGKKD